jgi:hypothetical protein
MTRDPESYFPADYRAARRGFIAACEARGLDAIARVAPGVQGRDGKPLFMDAVALGPRDAARALLLICGTHGVEGYFGSAVLTGLLREGMAPPPGARLVMIHALNPFGFAWDRRVNEDNVDLNRNFIDHAAPPDNPGYDALAGAIAPSDASDAGFARADAVLDAYAREHGASAFQAAISAGQYRHPDGLFYGGAAPAWSAKALASVLIEDLAKVTRLVAMDFHTGLGIGGAGEMIIEAAPESPAFARARAIWGDRAVSEAGGQSQSVPLTGTLDQGLAALLPGVELTHGVLEVGTVPLPAMLRALRLANWQDRFAADTARAPEIAAAMRAAFYTDTPDWKRAVWRLARDGVESALAALA